MIVPGAAAPGELPGELQRSERTLFFLRPANFVFSQSTLRFATSFCQNGSGEAWTEYFANRLNYVILK